MSNDASRAALIGTMSGCRELLGELTLRINQEIDEAQQNNNTVRRDQLIDFLTRVTEAIQMLNRQDIAAIDSQFEPLNEQLRQLTQSMKTRMDQNQKIGQNLQNFAGLLNGITGAAGQIFG